jgi:hypothetical protein
VAVKKSKKRTQAADEGAAVRRWRDAMGHLLAVLAGGPKGAHRNEDSEFARDSKERRHYASIAARDATLAMVDAVRAARADAVSVRELAAWLGKGDLLELDDLLGLWRRVAAIVDEIEAETQGTKAKSKDAPYVPDELDRTILKELKRQSGCWILTSDLRKRCTPWTKGCGMRAENEDQSAWRKRLSRLKKEKLIERAGWKVKWAGKEV